MELRTGTVTIRNVTYTVSELNGKQMKAVRKLLDKPEEKGGMQSLVTYFCSADPKFESVEAVDMLPQAVIEAIAAKAFELGKDETAQGGTTSPEA